MQPEQQLAPTTPPAESAPAPEVPVTETINRPQAQPIQWQAPEYVQERRSPWWFIWFWIVAVVLMIVALFIVKSVTFAVLIPVMAAALMLYSHRPPHELGYVLSDKGLYINEKLHPMSEFRSFGILTEDALPGLMLIPVKRFRPGLTVHFPPDYGEAIVDFLGSRLPMQELKLDFFDRIIKKLHI